ncbi:MAG: four helix bundle protein [Bacteroidales bacterium]|nr:four helix bundle protein [Bacteroidales bacterium]
MDYENDKNNTFFRFEDLRIYHKALSYAKWINEVSSPHFEMQNKVIIERFNTSSHDIVLNIAEGSARNKSQFIYYLKMAKSSVRQCLVFTSICHQLGFFSEEEEDESRMQLMEMTKMIGALISSLQRNNNNKRVDGSSEYEDDLPVD